MTEHTQGIRFKRRNAGTREKLATLRQKVMHFRIHSAAARLAGVFINNMKMKMAKH